MCLIVEFSLVSWKYTFYKCNLKKKMLCIYYVSVFVLFI